MVSVNSGGVALGSGKEAEGSRSIENEWRGRLRPKVHEASVTAALLLKYALCVRQPTSTFP